MTPIPKRHPLISPRLHQKMRKGVEMITWKRLVQFIGQKTVLKILRGCNNPPFEEEG